MSKHRIGALVAAAALTLTFAGTALADGTVDWNGKNGADAQPCTGDHAGQTHWIFSDGGGSVTAADLTVDGVDQGAMEQNGGGSFSLYVNSGLPDSASVSFTGSLGNNAVLTISCLGTDTTTTTTTTQPETTTTTTTTEPETTTTTTTTEPETTTTTTTTAPETTTTTSMSTTTSSTASETTSSKPTPPSTDTIGATTSSGSVSTGLLLVLAGILAAVLVVVPAAARSRR